MEALSLDDFFPKAKPAVDATQFNLLHAHDEWGDNRIYNAIQLATYNQHQRNLLHYDIRKRFAYKKSKGLLV